MRVVPAKLGVPGESLAALARGTARPATLCAVSGDVSEGQGSRWASFDPFGFAPPPLSSSQGGNGHAGPEPDCVCGHVGFQAQRNTFRLCVYDLLCVCVFSEYIDIMCASRSTSIHCVSLLISLSSCGVAPRFSLRDTVTRHASLATASLASTSTRFLGSLPAVSLLSQIQTRASRTTGFRVEGSVCGQDLLELGELASEAPFRRGLRFLIQLHQPLLRSLHTNLKDSIF